MLFSLASCAVILGIMSARGPLAALMSWRPLAEMGRITYGLYLYHWPIFLWLTEQRTGLTRWPLFAVRLVVTFAAAIFSFRFVERPILRGASLGLRGRARFVLAPAVAVIVVGAAFAAVNRTAYDPLAALKGTASSQVVPPASGGGPFNLLVIPATANNAVVGRLQKVAASDHSARVTVAAPFACVGGLVAVKGGRTCANWASSWAALIQRENPDAVLLYVDDWAGESLASLSGPSSEQQTDAAAGILSSAFDLLTARGA